MTAQLPARTAPTRVLPAAARRLPARDRVWAGLRTAFVLTTADPLDSVGVRDRLVSLAEHEPGLSYFTVPDPGRPDRVSPAGTAAVAAGRAGAVPILATGTDDVAALAERLLNHPCTGPSVQVGVGEGIVGVCYPHVLGDGLSVLRHSRRLLTGPDPDATAERPAAGPGATRPVLSALRERFRSLEAVRTVAREPRPVVPSGAGGVTGAQQVGVLYGLLPRARLAQVKAWRRASGADASVFICVMTAAWQAALEQGLGRRGDGAVVAYDLRPELPRRTVVDRNFVGATYISPQDNADPDSVHRVVASAKNSGRALVGLALATARESLRPRTPWPVLPSPDLTPVLSFCHMRVERILPRALLAPEGGQPSLCVATLPASAGSVGVFLVDVGTEVHVSMVFWEPCTDRTRVQAALDALIADPTGYLPSTPAETRR